MYFRKNHKKKNNKNKKGIPSLYLKKNTNILEQSFQNTNRDISYYQCDSKKETIGLFISPTFDRAKEKIKTKNIIGIISPLASDANGF